MHDFKKIDYLKYGNKRQKLAYQDLTEIGIFEILNSFKPLLAGTIPIQIDIEQSDLDVICEYDIKASFRKVLLNSFGKMPEFELIEKKYHSRESIIARFKTRHFIIEVFGQNYPSSKQNAFRHMLIEAKILEKEGEEFKKQIIVLKKAGYKTEPAFAKLLSLEGDPYLALLNFKF